MKYKVLKPFHDLENEVDRGQGEVVESTKKRFNEILKKLPGYIEEVVDEIIEEVTEDDNE